MLTVAVIPELQQAVHLSRELQCVGVRAQVDGAASQADGLKACLALGYRVRVPATQLTRAHRLVAANIARP